MSPPGPLARAAASLLGAVSLLALWHAAGSRRWFDGAVPAPAAVWDALREERNRRLFRRAIGTTVGESVRGLVIGAGVAIVLAALPLLVPALRATAERIAATVQALPVIVLGPVLVSLVSAARVPVIIASLGAFFAMFVPASGGFASLSATHLDVANAYGAGRWKRLIKLQIPAAVPGIATGIRLAAPAAVLGAAFGEWFGADRGLGVLLVTSMRDVRIPLLWATALLLTSACAIGYGGGTALERAARARMQ